MSRSFSLKTIQIDITLGKGSFAGGGNTKTIEGLACDVSIDKPGDTQRHTANVSIWGLSRDALHQLTTLGPRPLESYYNTIAIKAGEKNGPVSLAFQGEITGAYADFSGAPDIRMAIEASSGFYPAQKPQPDVTVKGEVPAEQLFTQFATQAGYAFRNEGVTASVNNAWFHGSPIAKLRKIARDIACELIIDDGLVLIMPKGSARPNSLTALSKETGLIGYPTLTHDGISCRCIYNPSLNFGGLISVTSEVPNASGLWRINRLSHDLSAYKPGGGDWLTSINAERME